MSDDLRADARLVLDKPTVASKYDAAAQRLARGYLALRDELAEAARLLDTAAQLADHGQPLSSATLYAGTDRIRAALAEGR